MDSSLVIELAAIFVLILANSFFALSEFSVIASRRSKLRQKTALGKPGARAAEKLYDDPDKFLASIQVGITLFGTLAGVFGGATIALKLEQWMEQLPIDLVASSAGPFSVTIVAVFITIVAVIVGELVPKYVALSHPERFARLVARPVSLFIKASSFFATFLSASSNLIVRLLGVRSDNSRDHVTEDDINQMIFHGREKGVFDAMEERLIKSVFDFADSNVRGAMTPRTGVTGIEINSTSSEIIDIIAEHEFSRYPIFEKTLDNVVGILFAKDIIIRRLNPDMIILKDLCREAMFVPDSMPLSRLLDEFKRKKKHIAIVLDDHGGTAGIVTMEDVLEELVGEIRDEYDMEQAPLVRHSDRVALADASVRIGAINELMSTSLPADQSDNIAGLVMQHLGRLPGKDEEIRIADTAITVMERDNNRLLRLRLEKEEDKAD